MLLAQAPDTCWSADLIYRILVVVQYNCFTFVGKAFWLPYQILTAKGEDAEPRPYTICSYLESCRAMLG